MNEEETIKDLSNAIYVLRRKLIQKHNMQKRWRLQCEELLKVNVKLEKEIRKYKQEEANKLSGLLSVGAVHIPKINRKYKFKE